MKFSKKDFQIKFLTNLIASNPFLGFISINNFDVKGKINLKNKLNKIGFDFRVLKNKLFITVINQNFSQYKNLESLPQGFSIVIYPIQKDFKFSNLQDLSKFLQKNSNLLFLGGFYNNELINKFFLERILKLKSSTEVFGELISIINRSQFSIMNSLKQAPTNIVRCLENIDSTNK